MKSAIKFNHLVINHNKPTMQQQPEILQMCKHTTSATTTHVEVFVCKTKKSKYFQMFKYAHKYMHAGNTQNFVAC